MDQNFQPSMFFKFFFTDDTTYHQSLEEVDYNSSLDSNKIRSSAGLAVNWFSAIGPLSFSYAIPLSDADTDVTEKFRFQIVHL